MLRLNERSRASWIVTRPVFIKQALICGVAFVHAEKLPTFSQQNPSVPFWTKSHPPWASSLPSTSSFFCRRLPCWHIWEAGTVPVFHILSSHGIGTVWQLGSHSHLLATEPETNPIDTFLILPNSPSRIWTCAQMDMQWKSHCFKIPVDGLHFSTFDIKKTPQRIHCPKNWFGSCFLLKITATIYIEMTCCRFAYYLLSTSLKFSPSGRSV